MLKLVYVASPSYSGSTLLTFLLNAHRSVATIGELKWGRIDLTTYRCSCGHLLTVCPFWKSVAAAVHRRGLPFDLQRPRTDFRCRKHPLADRIVRARVGGAAFEGVRTAMVDLLPEFRTSRGTIRKVNRAVIEAVLRLKNAQVFVDASKDPVRAKYLMETGDYDLRIIQLVRDGRAVTHSAMKHEHVSPEHAAREWLRTHEQIDRLARTLGRDKVIRIGYEDLCSNPQDAMQSIWDFMALTSCDITRDFRRVEHHILGNRMRLKSDSQIVLDEKWRSELSAEDVDAFDRTAGDLNRVFNYT